MKTRYSIVVILTSIVMVSFGSAQYADGICMPNQDWPDTPCYGCFSCYPGLEQEKLDWEPYYDYKGSSWMNAKKLQLDSAISDNSLREWFEQNDAHKNVHRYYFLHGDVPNIYGKTFEEALGFEQAWDAVKNSSPDAPTLLWNYHDVIFDGTLVEVDLAVTLTGDDVPLYHIKANEYFKGEKNSDLISAIENPDDVEFELFENGLFYLKKLDNQNWYTVTIASVKTFGNCDARQLIEISPTLPNEKHPVSAPAHPMGIDPCVPDYFDVDPDGSVEDAYNSKQEQTSESRSVFLRHGFHLLQLPPLKQFKSGISLDEIQCKQDLILVQRHDGNPACVKTATSEILRERGWLTCEDQKLTRGPPCGAQSSTGMPRYGGIDNYQYVQIQDWIESCRQEFSYEQCDVEVRKQIRYANQTQFESPYLAVRNPEICLYLDLICPENYAFRGIEKDGYVIVEYSHEWDDEYYEFVIENDSIKSVRYSGDNFNR